MEIATSGKSPKGSPPDMHVVKDKTLHLPGTPIHNWSEAEVYSIPAGSACSPMLPALPNGGTDFLGRTLSEKTLGTRGAITAVTKE